MTAANAPETLRDMALVLAHPVVGPMSVKAVPVTLNGIADDIDDVVRAARALLKATAGDPNLSPEWERLSDLVGS
jgi:hypothetical protein